MSEEHDKTSDLLTSLLETFFRKFFHDAVVANSRDIVEDEVNRTVNSLVTACLAEYNVKLLMNYGLKELRKDSGDIAFPPVIIDHYNVREAVAAQRKLSNKPKCKDLSSPPEVSIQSSTAQNFVEELSKLSRVDAIPNFSWKTAAAFQLDVNEVVKKSVNWSIRNLPFKVNQSEENVNWKVEICLKKPQGTSESDSTHVDSKILLAKMLVKLLQTSGYSVNGEGNSFTVVPSDVNFQNVLVAFLDSESGEKVFVEKDPVDFYTKYSGGVVILYNYARLKSILDKYDGLIETDDYPSLPRLSEVDFSTLGQAKEEVALIFMLFLWPRALSGVVNLSRNSADKINTSFLFDFVKNFAKVFDAFYNHVVVIVPKSTPHNFGGMAARIWLLKAVAKVFEQFMDLASMEAERISEA